MLRYQKNALTGVTREMFAFIWHNRVTYALYLLLATCAYMSVEVLIGERLISFEEGILFDVESFPLSLPLVFTALATAVFATPLHNFIIRGEKILFPRYVGRVLIFTAFELILSLLFALWLIKLADVFMFGPELIVPLTYLFAALVVAVILTTVLPHIAITPVDKLNILEATKLSAGFRFSICAKLLRLSVAIGLIIFGVGKLLSNLSQLLPSEDTIVGYYAPLLVENLGYSVSGLGFVTLASLIYIRLNQFGAELDQTESEHQKIEAD